MKEYNSYMDYFLTIQKSKTLLVACVVAMFAVWVVYRIEYQLRRKKRVESYRGNKKIIHQISDYTSRNGGWDYDT
jgi:hypothetical protein